MQGESSTSEHEKRFNLAELSRLLVMRGMPSQQVIGSEAGVSQSTVSRAINGRIVGQSAGAKALWTYANGRAELLRTGGDATIDGGTPTKRRRRATSGAGTDRKSKAGTRGELGRKALDGLREYLADRFDPTLVIEQLAVLRRAQGTGRRSEATDATVRR